jgi:hypothetical protein
MREHPRAQGGSRTAHHYFILSCQERQLEADFATGDLAQIPLGTPSVLASVCSDNHRTGKYLNTGYSLHALDYNESLSNALNRRGKDCD